MGLKRKLICLCICWFFFFFLGFIRNLSSQVTLPNEPDGPKMKTEVPGPESLRNLKELEELMV